MSLQFNRLPQYTQFKILSYLSLSIIHKVFQENKALYNISHNEEFWHFKLLNLKPITVTNKNYYLLNVQQYLEYKAKRLFNSLASDNQLVLVDVSLDQNYGMYHPSCVDCVENAFMTLNLG